jgi:hypothetical protein
MSHVPQIQFDFAEKFSNKLEVTEEPRYKSSFPNRITTL